MTDPTLNHSHASDTQLGDTPPDVAGAARELGLKPVRAWVPDETKKARTAGAERVRRCRAKAEQRGLKQLSITVPEELHPALKALAARTKAGEPALAVLAELLPELSAASGDPTDKDPAEPLAWLKTLPAELHPMLKTLVARMQAGEPLRVALAQLLSKDGITPISPAGKDLEPSPAWLDTLPAWRRWLLRWLLPSSVAKPH